MADVQAHGPAARAAFDAQRRARPESQRTQPVMATPEPRVSDVRQRQQLAIAELEGAIVPDKPQAANTAMQVIDIAVKGAVLGTKSCSDRFGIGPVPAHG